MGDLIDLGASRLDPKTNALLVQCKSAGVSESDAPDYGEISSMCALGVTAKPFPGTAQGIIDDTVAGTNGVIVGARDIGSAEVYGDIEDGDTVLHGTGPEHKSQVRCQKKTISLVTEDDDGFNVVINMDGPAKKVQINCAGHMFELSKENGITLTDSSGGCLQVMGGSIFVTGVLVLGGRTINPALSFMMGPASGSPGGPASPPMVPAQGVFLGL